MSDELHSFDNGENKSFTGLYYDDDNNGSSNNKNSSSSSSNASDAKSIRSLKSYESTASTNNSNQFIGDTTHAPALLNPHIQSILHHAHDVSY